MTKHRVLILSASAGTGHLRAADAIEKVCRSDPRVSEVVNVDALSYTNKLFRDFYSKLYTQLINAAPTFLGWWYDTSDEPWKTDKMRFMLDRLNTGPLVKLITDLKPDITICTHFLPAEIISHLITQRKIAARLSIVVTDFDFHSMWLSRAFHRYFVALEETKVHLTMLGLPEDRITVSGIPIDPVFAESKNHDAIRARYKLVPGIPVILVSAGALSVGPAEHVVDMLKKLRNSAQIMVVCGKNENMKAKVEESVRNSCPQHLTYTVLGYTTEIDQLMAVSDLFVGKPGGLTTAEALASGLPMVIVSPIPGQEERNSDHLLEKGVAIKCNELTTMAYKIDSLLENPSHIRSMRAAAKRFSRPFAAQTVVSTLLRERFSYPITVSEEKQESMARAARKI